MPEMPYPHPAAGRLPAVPSRILPFARLAPAVNQFHSRGILHNRMAHTADEFVLFHPHADLSSMAMGPFLA